MEILLFVPMLAVIMFEQTHVVTNAGSFLFCYFLL